RTYFGFGEALVSMPLLTLIGLDIHTSVSVIGLAGILVRTYFGFGEALVSMPLLTLIGLDIHTSVSVIGLAG
ncbi:hypothetical protein MWR26_12690, partial [Staphylococcus saprophyticus]|nr:hypothetical protein [Staphylococcus saprophyticus]